MGVITGTWSFGLIIGPAIGGLLAHPAENIPSIFGHSQFLLTYPYFLPNFVTALTGVIGFILLILFFPETLDDPQSLTAYISSLCMCMCGRNPNMTTHTLVPSEDVDDHEAEEEEGEGVSNPIHTGKIHRSDKGHNYDRIESDSEAWSSHTTTAVAATVEAPFSSSSSLVHKVRHDATISKGGHSQYNSSDDQDLLKGMYTLNTRYTGEYYIPVHIIYLLTCILTTIYVIDDHIHLKPLSHHQQPQHHSIYTNHNRNDSFDEGGHHDDKDKVALSIHDDDDNNNNHTDESSKLKSDAYTSRLTSPSSSTSLHDSNDQDNNNNRTTANKATKSSSSNSNNSGGNTVMDIIRKPTVLRIVVTYMLISIVSVGKCIYMYYIPCCV